MSMRKLNIRRRESKLMSARSMVVDEEAAR
jgi:hypothetical protein